MALKFYREKFEHIYTEAAPLLEEHWKEIANHKELLYINPDAVTYQKAEELGKLLIITARDEGKLVGYFVWAMHNHPHYQHALVAEEDIHFLLPEYRKGLNGYFLIKNAVKLAKHFGAAMCTVREKWSHQHPALMKRLGFTPADIVYTMVLTDKEF